MTTVLREGPRAGTWGLPGWKQNEFWGRTGAYCFFTTDSASPTLPTIQAFKPFTSKGNWRNRLTSFILRCWQIPKTDFVSQRLCLQQNDLGIEGLSNMGPQPNTSRSTKYLMIPDSRNQSPGAQILFLFYFFPLDKTKLFCSNSAVYKSLIKAID